jgi:hypothetical protein
MSNPDTGRYARITHRLALGAASSDDESSQALAALLQRRVVESIAADCTPLVTSDLLSERLAQAIKALSRHGIALHLADAGVLVQGCFCESEACEHPAALLTRLVGSEFESIITNEGHKCLRMVGAFDSQAYTREASTSALRLRS